jgi:hypothetical protein
MLLLIQCSLVPRSLTRSSVCCTVGPAVDEVHMRYVSKQYPGLSLGGTGENHKHAHDTKSTPGIQLRVFC